MTRDELAEVCQMAQNLARNCGYFVFPCMESKAPATPRGFLDAATDGVGIRRLWLKFPGPLIGVATGERSGIDVLDVDCGGCDADATAKEIQKTEAARAWWHENAGRMPQTRVCATRRGGLHLVFQHREGIRNSQSRIHQGVDVRGDGGFAVCWYAAGYPCLDHAPPAPWPSWLLAAMTPPPPAPPQATRAASRASSGQNVGRKVAIALDLARGAPEGGKHDGLLRAARLLGGVQQAAGIGDEQAVALLLTALPTTVKCWRTAEATARDGLAFGRTAPLDLEVRRA